MAITLTGLGQQMPYNPDENSDAFISTPDLMEFLAVFGYEWQQQEILVDSIPLSLYLNSLQMMIESSALPEGTVPGQFLRWDGESWELVVPRVGCTIAEACNYDESAHVLDESKCVFTDACGVCGGPGSIYECGCADLSEGDCDCEGNVVDALGNCGGDCIADLDGDGICDDGDECVGQADECGVCNGPGPIYDCGCSGIPTLACDCLGNPDLDSDGVCDSEDDCIGELDAAGVCNGGCQIDADGDGICDDDGGDECFGDLDVCGVCNGPGPIYECGCASIEPGYCDCAGNVLGPDGNCEDCLSDNNGDGIYDESCGPCLGLTEIEYQGQTYGVAPFNGQCWFRENLNAGQFRDGGAIQVVQDDDVWSELYQTPALYLNPNDSVYGKLYNGWVARSNNICPNNWSVPTEELWTELILSLGGSEIAGGALKESGFNHWLEPNLGATNSSGLSILPAGEAGLEGQGIVGVGEQANVWTLPAVGSGLAVVLSNYSASTSSVAKSNKRGLSIRCVRDSVRLGCTDANYFEFNPDANVEDGSCAIQAIYGCSNPDFVEYDPTVNVDDGSCQELVGCESGSSVSYYGKEYAQVSIGGRCWFAENLATTRFTNGENIPFVFGDEISAQGSNDGAAVTVDSLNTLDVGLLYNFHAVEDPRGICPTGWHVGSIEDWDGLFDAAGLVGQSGTVLKSTEGWKNQYCTEPEGNGTDYFGFSVYPSGGANLFSSWNSDRCYKTDFWTSDRQGSSIYACVAYFHSQYSDAFTLCPQRPDSNVNAIRCIKDAQ